MKNNIFIIMIVVFSLLICSARLGAKERRGAEVVVQKLDGKKTRGELIAVKPNSLLLLESQTGADKAIDTGEIKDITIIRKSKALMFAGGGFLLGALAGTVHWQLAKESDDTSLTNPYMIAAYGGGLAIIGLLLGAEAGNDKQIELEGKPDSEIKEILEGLRKRARVRNFQ